MDLRHLSEGELDAMAADCDAKRSAWLEARPKAVAVSAEKARREQERADAALLAQLGPAQAKRLAALAQRVTPETVAAPADVPTE